MNHTKLTSKFDYAFVYIHVYLINRKSTNFLTTFRDVRITNDHGKLLTRRWMSLPQRDFPFSYDI